MENLLMEENGLYKLPIFQKFKMKLWYHLSFAVIEASFIFIFLDSDQHKFFYIIAGILLIIFFGYSWLGLISFSKPYLKITEDFFDYKWLFGHKVIPLDSIYQAELYSEKGIKKLGIRACIQGNMSFWEVPDQMLGLGMDYTVSIVCITFPNIDFEKLRLTIMSKVKDEYRR